MSMKDRLKKGLRKFSTAMNTGSLAGLAMSKGTKKKKMLEGMRKATGQSATQAAKIKRRTDIAAMRKSAGKSYKAVPKSAGFRKEMKKK